MNDVLMSSTSSGISLNDAWPSWAYGMGAIIWILCVLGTLIGIYRILNDKVFKRKKGQTNEEGVVASSIVLMCLGWVIVFLITVASAACSGINSLSSEWNLQWQSLLACHALAGLTSTTVATTSAMVVSSLSLRHASLYALGMNAKYHLATASALMFK